MGDLFIGLTVIALPLLFVILDDLFEVHLREKWRRK